MSASVNDLNFQPMGLDLPPQARFVIQRWPQNEDELWWFMKAVWGVGLPRKKVCPGHQTPFQAFADAYFARAPVSVWKASRGFGGKTKTLAMLGLMEALALSTYVVILGGSASQSLRVHEEMKESWGGRYAPRHLLEHETRFDTYMSNNGHIRALMASQRSVRGPHPTRLRMDEIDEMDLDILDAAMGQPMEQKGVDSQTVMSSTHQYPDKTMTAILNRAKENGWPVYHWCFHETSVLPQYGGWLTQRAIARKRTEVSKRMWDTEYELQEPSFEGRAIDTDSVDKMWDPTLGVHQGQEGEYLEFEVPIYTGEYTTGVDWAKHQDWTIITTYRTDTIPWKLVAWERLGRRPWPAMALRLDKRLRRYRGVAAHDATGLGTVVADLITQKAEDVTFTGRNKADLLSDYVMAIENGQLIGPRIEWAYNEHKYATNDDLYGSGHPPDSLVAGALAWHMRANKIPLVIPDVEDFVRATSPWSIY